MSHDKTLVTTISKPIYQGENNCDTIDIFIPSEYEGRDLSQCFVRLDYILPNGVSGFRVLNPDESTYKDYTLYHLVVDTELTAMMGRVKFWLTLLNGSNEMILKTSQSSFDVHESINITYGYSNIDELIKQLQELKVQKADNITINNNQEIQLEAEGNLIGNKIQINDVINLDN